MRLDSLGMVLAVGPLYAIWLGEQYSLVPKVLAPKLVL